MKLIEKGTRASRKGPPDYFTGAPVYLDELVSPIAPARAHLLRVTFLPGARTAWHTHPLGQSLTVVVGSCLIQEEGQMAQRLSPSDTIWIPPGVKHWHGATADAVMVHLALQEADVDGQTANWLEPVSDADYAAAQAV